MSHDVLAPHRVAIYAVPAPGTDWWERGSEWLGRCASRRCGLPMPEIGRVDAAVQTALTADPRRYGWHATLKAPFALAPGTDWIALHQAVQSVARGLQPFVLPPLQVQRIDDFLALVPPALHPANAQIQETAATCVTALQPLAAPLSDADLARRRAAGLTAQQDALLEQWGYPFVLDEFRFHMSLTGSLAQVDPPTQALVFEAAQEFFSDLPTLKFNSLALFAEPAPGADFVLLDHLEMGA